jgi:ribosomal 50S subunit-recycling heat shock protein
VRLDMWLKNSGVIPRRTVAKSACDEGLVEVNAKRAKASQEIRVGDEVVTRIGLRINRLRVEELPPKPVAKADRERVAMLLSSEKVDI